MLLLRKILWVFYLTVSLVFIQAAGVHVHVYNHDAGAVEHSHHDQGHHEPAHLSYDVSAPGHLGEVAEVDLSQQGWLKNTLVVSLLMALFLAVMVVLLPRLVTRVLWSPLRWLPFPSWVFSLRPPLRAPPL